MGCLYPILFLYSTVDGHLGCFQLLTLVNIAIVNLTVQIFLVYIQEWNCWIIWYICFPFIALTFMNLLGKLGCLKDDNCVKFCYHMSIPLAQEKSFDF